MNEFDDINIIIIMLCFYILLFYKNNNIVKLEIELIEAPRRNQTNTNKTQEFYLLTLVIIDFVFPLISFPDPLGTTE